VRSATNRRTASASTQPRDSDGGAARAILVREYQGMKGEQPLEERAYRIFNLLHGSFEADKL
jgi:hypothetical protein